MSRNQQKYTIHIQNRKVFYVRFIKSEREEVVSDDTEMLQSNHKVRNYQCDCVSIGQT